MKKVKADTLALYPNELMTVFTGIQKQLPVDNNVIEGITTLSRLNPFTYRQVNRKEKKGFPILYRPSKP
jgi:hypothetical protein